MKELENNFLNILDENESTLANDIVLGTDNKIDDELIGDGNDRGSGEKAGCKSQQTIYYGYKICTVYHKYAFYRIENGQYLDYYGVICRFANVDESLSFSSFSGISSLLTTSIRNAIIGWNKCWSGNAVFGTVISGITTDDLSAGLTGIYSTTTPFCYVTGLTLAPSGYSPVTGLSLPFYMMVYSGTTSALTIPPYDYSPPNTYFYIPERYVCFRISDTDDRVVCGAKVRCTFDYSLFPKHFSTPEDWIRTNSDGSVILFSNLIPNEVSAITFDIFRIGYNNDSFVSYSVNVYNYTSPDLSSDGIVLTANTPSKVLSREDIENDINPNVFALLPSDINSTTPYNINFNVDMFNTLGISALTDYPFTSNKVTLSANNLLRIKPMLEVETDDFTVGKANPVYIAFRDIISISSTTRQTIDKIDIDNYNEIELYLNFTASGTATQTAATTVRIDLSHFGANTWQNGYKTFQISKGESKSIRIRLDYQSTHGQITPGLSGFQYSALIGAVLVSPPAKKPSIFIDKQITCYRVLFENSGSTSNPGGGGIED